MSDASTGVEALLARIADPDALAGGGAAAALAGAAASALTAMVAGIAARHAPGDARAAEVVADADGMRRRLTELIGADIDAYQRVLEARRRRDAGRPAALREALVGATRVPLEVAETSLQILEHCVTVRPLARPSTVADVGVAGILAAAAVDGATLTARANLEGLDDPAFIAEAERRLDGLRRRADRVRAQLGPMFPDTTHGADATPR